MAVQCRPIPCQRCIACRHWPEASPLAAMIANFDDDGRSASVAVLTAEDVHWLHQLETVAPTRALLPMRETEKLGKLGLIEIRASKLTLTDRGRHLLNRL